MNTRQIGRRLPRKEDQRLLTGAGRFVDDLRFEGELHAAFLRAPHAHARIEAVETTEAMAMPGVSGVFTAEDLARDAVRDIPAMFLPADKRGQKPFAPAQPCSPGAMSAMSARDAGRRRADSMKTRLAGTSATSVRARRRAARRLGRKPANRKRSVGNPATINDVSTADAPGTAVTGIPSSMQARTRR